MNKENSIGGVALIPFVIFAVFYLGLSLASGDFYKVPMVIAFLVASASAFALHPLSKLEENMQIYTKGMGDSNIMMMCLIFILAGAFASVAKATGAVDSAVAISRYFIPPSLILPGMFCVSCFISLAIGTSCGTIAAVTPIAVTITRQLGIPTELMLGCVVGGSMFGDNMSMISDTTIAATRSLDISMRDKFLTNLAFATPAALVALAVYLIFGYTNVSASNSDIGISATDFLFASPYVIILLLSLLGGNVIALLTGATVLTGCIGIFSGKFDFWKFLDITGKGCLNMSETLIVAILSGGLLALVKYYGGIDFVLRSIRRCIKGKRGCEAGTALLTAAVNLFTANNTVAIVISGPIAKELATAYKCSPKRIASILDASSCVIQGVIPYGAQILIATGVANSSGVKISALKLVGQCWYPLLLLVAMIFWIALSGDRKKQN